MVYFTQTYGQDTGYGTESNWIDILEKVKQLIEKKRDINDIPINNCARPAPYSV